MQKISNIYFRTRMGVDYRVWITMTITVILSLFFLGFKLATNQPCYPVSLVVKGVMEHKAEHHYYVGEHITFNAKMKQGLDVVWDFGDGSAAVSGSEVKYSYKREGNYLLTVTVNGRCKESANIHITQVSLNTAVATPEKAPSDNGIIGKDFATTGELSIYQTELQASVYAWSVENNPSFGTKNGPKTSYSFVEPGSYLIQLKLDNDEAKVYRKRVVVSADAKAAKGVMPDELPPLPLPSPQEKPVASADETGANGASDNRPPPSSSSKFEVIPNQIFQGHFQDIAEGRGSIDEVAKYLCEGAQTKVRGNGKTYANLTLFCEELKGKKGMLGLGGKRKIKSVNAKREIGSNCVYWLEIEYK